LLGMLTQFFADGGKVQQPFVDFNKVSGIPPLPDRPPMFFKHGGRVYQTGAGDTEYYGSLNPTVFNRSGMIINIGNSTRMASDAVTMQHMRTPSIPLH